MADSFVWRDFKLYRIEGRVTFAKCLICHRQIDRWPHEEKGDYELRLSNHQRDHSLYPQEIEEHREKEWPPFQG